MMMIHKIYGMEDCTDTELLTLIIAQALSFNCACQVLVNNNIYTKKQLYS